MSNVTGVTDYKMQLYTPETSNTQSVMWGTPDEDSKRTSDITVETLGKDDFLKLLLAQLKNQDPLNPASNTEFVAQLAQFSTLEQLTTMNASLEKSLTYNKNVSESINNSMMVNFIGRNVSAESNSFLFDGENPATLKFELDKNMSSGRVEISDMDEKVVKIISLDAMGKGLGDVTWDGMTSLGVLANNGKYSYKVIAQDNVGNEFDSIPVFTGIVEGVSYRQGEAHLSIGGVLVPFDKVKQILDETLEQIPDE